MERFTYRLLRIDPERGQDWKAYARSVILFSLAGWLVLFLILRTQTLHPFNPENFHSGTWDLSFNTASSFVTNTNWQYYGGETTLSYFSQMAGLTVQNFVSAATGIAVAIALIRGIIARRSATPTLGNFWQDLVRASFYILLPISIIGAVLLVSQGVLQTLGGTVAGLARGPVASQEAIKELGTNGGGFFNVNSAYPFENPTGLSNLIELFLILCIPASLTYTYGRMVGSRRQGWALFSAMSVLFIASVVVVYIAEMHGTPAQHAAGVHTGIIDGSTGGNLEGKDQRFGIANSALWTAVTTVTSCGAVNAAFESLTGIGGLVPMVDLGYGESVFGGVGTGLYTMLLYVLLAVFIGGLMVGRTPEFLGKKVEAREIKLVSLGVLVTPLAVLLATRRGHGDQVRQAVDLRLRAAGLQRVAVRLHVAGQQQRLGLRRLHRLLPAQPRQHRRPRHHLRRPARRGDHARRALRADPARARRGRRAGRQARRPAGRWARCAPTRRPSSRCSAARSCSSAP